MSEPILTDEEHAALAAETFSAAKRAGEAGTPLDPRERELAELRAKRAELERKRAEQLEQTELDAELELERRKLRDAEALNAAIEQHGVPGRAITTIETDYGLLVIKRAGALKFRRFQDAGEYSTEAFEALVRPCIVHPPLVEWDEWLKEQPALLSRAAMAVARLAGVRMEELGKK